MQEYRNFAALALGLIVYPAFPLWCMERVLERVLECGVLTRSCYPLERTALSAVLERGSHR